MNKISNDAIRAHFNAYPSDVAYVLRITEADFGCEERLPGEGLKCLITLMTIHGTSMFETDDELLLDNRIEEGCWLTAPSYLLITRKAAND